MTGQAASEQTWVEAGLAPALEAVQEESGTGWLVRLETHCTVRVCTPLAQVTEQAPKLPKTHEKVSGSTVHCAPV